MCGPEPRVCDVPREGTMPTLTAPRAATVACALALCTATTQAQSGLYTHDLGFRIRVPDDWNNVPIQIDENWIVAKFLSEKSWISKDRDWNREHHPLMTIVVFTEDATRFQGWTEQQKGDTTFVRVTGLPYRDYRDYLKRNLQDGYYFEKEETVEAGDMEGSRFEILRHKSEPKLRLITCVFHGQDMDVAVEFEVLEDRLDRLRGECERALKSFRFDDRGILPNAPTTGESSRRTSDKLWTEFREEWKKTDVEERHRLRQDVEEQRFARVRAATPEDWVVEESPHFLVVSHADGRFTKRMVDAAEEFREWCDDNFADLSDEYVRRNVLRVCKDDAEWEAYRFKVSGDSWAYSIDDSREVVTYRDNYNGSSGRDAGYFFGDILQMYLADKDPYLLQYTPYWLRTGLYEYVSEAMLKGRRIEFDASDWEKEAMRELEREEKLETFQNLVTLDEKRFRNLVERDHRYRYQLTNAVRFLLGPGRRHKPLRDFLPRYFGAVIEHAEKNRDKWKAVDATYSAETEEEEEARRKERDDRYAERREAIHEAITKSVFDLSEKDWARIERAYAKFARD